MSIRIDPEFKTLIPPLAPDEYAQLEENIVKEGVRDPLVVWKVPNGDMILLDGHNRFEIAAKHSGIPFDIKELHFNGEGFGGDVRAQAKAWIIRNQFGRRNLSAYDRGVLALKLKPLIAEEAKKNQRASGGAVPQKSAKPVDTRQELAKLANVSHDTIRKVETIESKGSDTLKEQVRSGDKSINQAWLEIKRAEQPRMETPAERQEHIQGRHDEFQEKPVVTIEETKQDRQDKEYLATSLWKTLTEAIKPINSINVMADSKRIDMSLIGSIKMSLREDLDREIDCAIKTLEDIKQAIRR